VLLSRNDFSTLHKCTALNFLFINFLYGIELQRIALNTQQLLQLITMVLICTYSILLSPLYLFLPKFYIFLFQAYKSVDIVL
jgi:hypothetical protein